MKSSRKTTSPRRFDIFVCCAALRQVHELVEQHLDPLGVVAEHARDRRVPVARAVVVGAEHVDRAVEARGRACRRGRRRRRRGRSASAPSERISTRSSSSPYADERAQTAPSFSYVSSRGRNSGSRCSSSLCSAHASKWIRKRCSVDLDLLEHRRHRVAPAAARARRCRRRGSRPRAAPPRAGPRLDRGAEALHLGAGVVVVVLALDVVAGELEQAGDAVAVGAVPRGRDGDRAGRVRGDHLDLDALALSRRAAAVARRRRRGSRRARRRTRPARARG